MIKQIIKTYYNWKIYPRYPIQLVLYLNNICNLKCDFCEIGKRNTKEAGWGHELSEEEIDRVVDICIQGRISSLYVTGGEPFLSRSLWYLIKKCVENNFIIECITTNGTLMKNLSSEKIELLNKTVKRVVISMDSAEENKHDLSRGSKGVFNKIKSFVENYHKEKLFKLKIGFNVVIYKDNFLGLKNIIDLALEWKVDHINFQPISTDTIFVDMKSDSSKGNYSKFDQHLLTKEIVSADKYAQSHKVSTNLKVFKIWVPYYFHYLNSDDIFFKKMNGKILCSKVFNYIHINYNGDFLPCANLAPIANINDFDCLEKWQRCAQKLKYNFKKGYYCKSCRYCFCDFPANLRLSMLYYPIRNLRYLLKTAGYYLQRK